MVALSLLVLKTRQVEDLRAFYGALGIAFVVEQHGQGPLHYAAECDALVIEIYPLAEDDPPADTTTRLGFVVEQLETLMQNLGSLGVTVVTTPKTTAWGYRAVVRDPDGRAVELCQR